MTFLRIRLSVLLFMPGLPVAVSLHFIFLCSQIETDGYII